MTISSRMGLSALAAALVALSLLRDGAGAEEPLTQLTQVKVTTNMGEFVIEVNNDRAPITSADFLRYVREGFYSNTLIHRVVANFVIQGGGHDAKTLALKRGSLACSSRVLSGCAATNCGTPSSSLSGTSYGKTVSHVGAVSVAFVLPPFCTANHTTFECGRLSLPMSPMARMLPLALPSKQTAGCSTSPRVP